MGDPGDASILCRLREHRTAACLSQHQLGQRVGLSRQAILAIEAGRQTPSTAIALKLADTLGCRVEDLFALPTEPALHATLDPEHARGTDARVALGRVDGSWVALPLMGDDQAADGVLVAEPGCAGTRVRPLFSPETLEHNVLVSGCAPLLGILAGCLGRQSVSARATWVPASSTRALTLLRTGLVHVAGVHLVDADAPGGHGVVVRAQLPAQRVTIINLTRWRQGLAVARGNPRSHMQAHDILRPDIRLARREAGSGAERLLQRVLTRLGHSAPAPHGPVARGHAEVARWVRLGVVDAGITIEAAALAEGLSFVPLAEERFDLVVPTARLSMAPITQLLELLERPAFLTNARQLAGYDLALAGHAESIAAD